MQPCNSGGDACSNSLAVAVLFGRSGSQLDAAERVSACVACNLVQEGQRVAVVVTEAANELLLPHDRLLHSAEYGHELGRVVVDVAAMRVKEVTAPRQVEL